MLILLKQQAQRICALRNQLNRFSRFASNTSRVTYDPNAFYWNDRYDKNEARFEKVLIANRGEIACRIIQTCRRFGIKTVAVHSEADTMAKFVEMADEAVCIGPPPSSKSYLNMDVILDAVKRTGAQAVHPGYGFLSENTLFAKRLHDAGVAFVGPNSEAVRAMGDKLESKRIAHKAGVSTVPGYDGSLRTVDEAVQIAKQVGYPVMVKATGGGGGKGMRVCRNEKELISGFRLAQDEARSSFADDKMLIERFIDEPRHIEVQVLCDKHGNAVHVNERECSIQRRNQKVIEEAPSTFVSPELRAKMGAQAVQLALAVGYDSAGTCEFMVDSDGNFFFLEMNTRLQVEHPITECITGIDLVHQMLRIAKGHPLSYKQKDIPIRGWALESRVYAEDPYKSFGLPSIGRLSAYEEPSYLENVRCDSGIREGSEISVYYDPMICKLITYGPNRNDCIRTMNDALDRYVIRGVTHNIALLRDILAEKRFLEGNISTKYLPTVYPDGFKGRHLSVADRVQLAAFAAVVRAKRELRNLASPTSSGRWHFVVQLADHGQMTRTECNVELADKVFQVQLTEQAKGDKPITLHLDDNFSLRDSVVNVTDAGRTSETIKDVTSRTFQLLSSNAVGDLSIQYCGTKYAIAVQSSKQLEFGSLMPTKKTEVRGGDVKAPMPGLLKSVAVKVGDQVTEGQEVCVLEAMKMQNSLAAPRTGKIVKLHFAVGTSVNEDDLIAEIK